MLDYGFTAKYVTYFYAPFSKIIKYNKQRDENLV